MLKRTILAAALCSAAAGPALAEELNIVYVERIPYYYTENGEAKGTLLDIARAVAEKAGLTVTTASMPSKRVVAEIEAGTKPFCSINWNKKPEREKIGKFTVPAFPGEKMVVVARKESEADIKKHATFADLTKDPALKLGAVDGWRLGDFYDGLMDKMKGNIEKATVTPAQNISKVAAKRVTYTLIEEGELEHAIKTAGESRDTLATLNFSDIPQDPPAYFWCSRAVDDAVIGKLNAAIQELYPDLGK